MRGRNLRYLLIVGTNSRAVNFAKKIESRPELGYIIAGFVDNSWQHIDEFKHSDYKLVSDFDGFNNFIRNHVVDEVVIALPLNSLYKQASHIFDACEQQGVIVRYLSDLFNPKVSRSRTESLEGEPIISHYSGAMEGWQLGIKRAMDFVLAGVLLVIASPLLLLTALLIKMETSGPVLFIQERVGLNKRRFRLYKFRTMVDGAAELQDELEILNEASGPVFKIKNDPRITKTGKFLRKTSIDELPQLFNVLKADMSLVGPRPLPMRDYHGFSKDWHRRRFCVRPGITCLWQVNGRSSIPFEKWMELDMHYIDKWSLLLDLKILLRTIPSVFKSTGAI